MRITCPNCTASFDVPTELLGKKGRSLKCASCGHSWYQTPHVETIDLAEIMGQEYAARAKADMLRPAPAPPPGKAGTALIAAPGMAPRSMAAAPAPASAAPLGVSLMRKDPAPAQAARPTAQSWNTAKALGVAGTPPRSGGGMPAQAGAAAAPSWYQPEKPQKIAPPPAGAPSWYQPEPPKQMGPSALAGAPSWYQPDPATQRPVGPERVLQHQADPAAPMRGGGVLASVPAPPMRGGGVLAAMPDPRLSPSAAALGGQSLRGQAGAGAVGDVSRSWMQPQNAPPGGAMPGAPGFSGAPSGALMAPGQGIPGQALPGQAPAAALLRGQSMLRQAGAGIAGDTSVSWNQRAPAPPLGAPGGQPAQSLMGAAGAGVPGEAAVSWNQPGMVPPPGVAGAALGQSLMGQAGAGAVGDGSVSWVQQPGAAMAPAGPGAPGVSQLSGAIQASGLGAQSMLDGTVRAPGQPGQSMIMPTAQGPGAAAVSQMTGVIQAPGLGSQSMLDGTLQAPGQPGQSTLQAPGGAPGAPGVSQLGQPGGPGAPGVSQLGQPGGPGAPGQSMMAPPAAGTTAAAADAKAGEPGAFLLEKGKTESSAALIAGESKAKDDPAAPLWSGAKEDEELVDPDADRPDFGASEEAAAAAADEAQNEGAAAEDEDGAGGAGRVILKPERQIDPAFITAGLMVLAVGCVAMLLWLERGPLAKAWPGFDAIYSKLGMESKRPGEGLRLTQSGTRLMRIGGIETLVVKGYISNISDKERPVAHIRLQLVNATNQVVQETSTAPSQSKLAAGASMDFEVKLELPNMTAAKNVVVSWGE